MPDSLEPLPPPPGFQRVDRPGGFAEHIGPIFERRDPDGGYARAFRVDSRHTNGLKNAHGGMLLTFADMAFGHAVAVERDHWWVTVRLTCDFLGPAEVGDWVEGAGKVLWAQGSLVAVRGRAWVGERTVLTGQGVFKAIAPRG